jgi:hypothetical protein
MRFGLFGLAIKQYHKKSILFHFSFLLIYLLEQFNMPSRSDFVLLRTVPILRESCFTVSNRRPVPVTPDGRIADAASF